MALKPFWIFVATGLGAAVVKLVGLGVLLRVLLGLLAIGAVLLGVGVVAPPSVEEIVQQVGSRLGDWTYVLVGVNAFLETGAFLGFLAPGETMVLFGGVLAGEGVIDLQTLIIVVWLCAMAGDLSSYAIGRRYGRDFLLRHGERVKIGEPQVRAVERFFWRHGRTTLLLGRWVGMIRPLVPFLAGSSRMRFWEFLLIDIISTFLWAAGLCVLGSVFWQNFDELVGLVGRALFILATVIVVGTVLAVGISTRRDPRRGAHVDRWLEHQLHHHPTTTRPLAALWRLIGLLEPRFPGRRRTQPADEGATVAEPDRDEAGTPTPR